MVSKQRKAKKSQSSSVARTLLHIFVPHKGNYYHPHIIRPLGLMIVLGMVVAAYSYGSVSQSSVKGVSTSAISAQTLLVESNKERARSGAGSLELNQALTKAASLKANDMLARQYWSHSAPDGTSPWHWLEVVDYQYSYAGENLAKGFDSSAAVINAWMSSDKHRQNLLNTRYQQVGFAVASGRLENTQTTVVVALYASPASQSGALIAKNTSISSSEGLSLVTQFGIGLQSMNPTMLGSILILATVATVALLAYVQRRHLPLAMRKGWKTHHALYKTVATTGIILLLITLYGDGQIL